MGDSQFEVPTVQNLHGLEACYRRLIKVAIPEWYLGRSASYHLYETERKNALRTRVLLDLRRGKLPDALTQEVVSFSRASEMKCLEKDKCPSGYLTRE